jgi:hypothetical protein
MSIILWVSPKLPRFRYPHGVRLPGGSPACSHGLAWSDPPIAPVSSKYPLVVVLECLLAFQRRRLQETGEYTMLIIVC